MAVKSFLKVPDIPGPSEAVGHKGEIEVLGWSWGMSQSGTMHIEAGKADFEDIQLVARTSEASPLLMQACASGKHFPTAVLTSRRGGKQPLDFLKVTLTDVVVAAYAVDVSDEEPVDSLALNFAKIETAFTAVDKSGKPKPPVTAGWDLKANKKI